MAVEARSPSSFFYPHPQWPGTPTLLHLRPKQLGSLCSSYIWFQRMSRCSSFLADTPFPGGGRPFNVIIYCWRTGPLAHLPSTPVCVGPLHSGGASFLSILWNLCCPHLRGYSEIYATTRGNLGPRGSL